MRLGLAQATRGASANRPKGALTTEVVGLVCPEEAMPHSSW